MAYKIKSAIAREIFEAGSFDYYNGEFLVWDLPCAIFPINSVILIHKLKEDFPEFSMQDLSYQIGKMQSHRGNNLMVQRFGFEMSEKFIKDTLGKCELLGMGTLELLDFNIKDKSFTIVNTNNPYANQYLKVFGVQKNAVCHYLRGLCAGNFQAFFEDEEMLCIEVSCRTKGEQACVFQVRPKSKWDPNDPLVKRQSIRGRLPRKVFDEYYNWDSLVSDSAGAPRKKQQEANDKKRIDKVLEELKRSRI